MYITRLCNVEYTEGKSRVLVSGGEGMQRELIQKYLSLGEGMFGANSSLIEANERWHGGINFNKHKYVMITQRLIST